jgi:hypothetical protein
MCTVANQSQQLFILTFDNGTADDFLILGFFFFEYSLEREYQLSWVGSVAYSLNARSTQLTLLTDDERALSQRARKDHPWYVQELESRE